MIEILGLWIAPILLGLSFFIMTWHLFSAIYEGAEIFSGTYSSKTAKQFEDIFLFIPQKKLEELRWTSAITIFILTFFIFGQLTTPEGVAIGLISGLISGTIALNIPLGIVKILKKRRLEKFNSQLVDTLMSISNSLKAGFSINQAIESIATNSDGPIAQEFSVFLQQVRVGVNFEDAFTDMERRVESEDLSLVISAIKTARKTGGNLTEILESIAKTIRERLRIANRIKTLTAQGRLQGIVVGSMPILIAIAMLIVDPETMKPFLYSSQGLVIMAIVAILLTMGAFFIKKIISIDI